MQRLRRARQRGERGATLVEAAFLLPLFFFLVFGILEFGFAFKDYLTLANATRDGARTGTTAGNQPNADYLILREIQAAASAMPDGSIERIVIFHAAGPESDVPAGCKAGTASSGSGTPDYDGACNVYTPSDFALDADEFDCGGPGSAPDGDWCPLVRKVAVTGSQGPPDYLGIWMEVRYDYITGLFPGGGMTFTDTTIMRIEPRIVS